MTLSDRLAQRLTAHAPEGAPLGLAVSGGSDSTALMHLAAQTGRDLRVATVDHGLRPEAATEADAVGAAARSLGLSHDVLLWHGWNGRGNLQDQARRARQDLLRQWARLQGLAGIVLGHTMEDQAETVLMRLARGSGVDGLSGMAERRVDETGMIWLRPLLGERRATLRDWLSGQGLTWVDDPSNEDPRFDRVRTRRLLSGCEDLGVSVDGLVDTAARMAAARQVLGQAAADAAERLLSVRAGAVQLDQALWGLADDTRWRVISAGLCLVGEDPYRPAMKALLRAEALLGQGRRHTLHGCLMVPERSGLRIQPEPARLADRMSDLPGTWGAWRLRGPQVPIAHVAMLGETGLAQLPDWRHAGLPHELALCTPGIWSGPDLLAAPVLSQTPMGEDMLWTAEPIWNKAAFKSLLLSD